MTYNCTPRGAVTYCKRIATRCRQAATLEQATTPVLDPAALERAKSPFHGKTRRRGGGKHRPWVLFLQFCSALFRSLMTH